jgi:hypothetical protein
VAIPKRARKNPGYITEILLKVALNTINHTKPKMLNVYLNELEPNRNWVNLQV